jgi:6-phosphogluconolactonase/glucosamine-6-phosphate isomerase/deaminase
MEIKVLAGAESVAREGAAIIAADAQAALAARGRFILAVSGGQTPWLMLRELAGEESLGTGSMWPRSTSVWRRRGIPTET